MVEIETLLRVAKLEVQNKSLMYIVRHCWDVTIPKGYRNSSFDYVFREKSLAILKV